MTDERRWADPDIEKYIEPMLTQAQPDSWYDEYGGYVYGWRGNPIVAAILMCRKKIKSQAEKIAELERDLHHYRNRYNEAAVLAKQLLGVK